MFKRYFEDELEYVRELEAAFAARYPEAAAELDLLGHDPAMARLTQGFSFLTAHIRERLEGGYPELIHPLLEEITPFVLRPTPAAMLVGFTPKPGMLRKRHRLEPYTAIFTRPIDGTRCEFRTCAPLDLLPWSIRALSLEAPSATRAYLRVRLELTEGASLAGCEGIPLRFHLTGELARRYALFWSLTRDLRGIEVRALAGAPATVVQTRRLAPRALAPAGFRMEESLLSVAEALSQGGGGARGSTPPATSPSSPAPYVLAQRHLLEFFLFPEKLLCVELEPQDWILQVRDLTGLELSFELERTAGPWLEPEPGDLRLHCVPAINLFPHTAAPLRFQADRAGYLVRPSIPADGGRDERDHTRHYELYAVTGVSGMQRRTTRVRFLPYFHPSAIGALHREDTLLYRLEHRPAVAWRPGDRQSEHEVARPAVDSWISFLGLEEGGLPTGNLQVDLLATNGDLPRHMRAADLCLPSKGVEPFLEFKGLEPVRAPAPPRLEPSGMARVVAWLRHGPRAVRDRDALRRLLTFYQPAAGLDLGAEQVLTRLFDAITDLDVHAAQQMAGAPPVPVLGHVIRMRIDDARLEHPGMALLFASALQRYLVDTSTWDTCISLEVRLESGPELTWSPTLGTMRPL